MPRIAHKRRVWKSSTKWLSWTVEKGAESRVGTEDHLKWFRSRHERYLAEKAAVILNAELDPGTGWCAASSGWSSRALLPDEHYKYNSAVAGKAATDLLFGGDRKSADAEKTEVLKAEQAAIEEAQRKNDAHKRAEEALKKQQEAEMEAAESEGERARLEEEFQRERLLRQQGTEAAAKRKKEQRAKQTSEVTKLKWQRVRSNMMRPAVIIDIFLFTVAVCAADIGSDVAVARTFAVRQYWVFFGVALGLMILPMCLCWFRFYVDGKAKWYEAPMYVLQLKTLQEVYEALKTEDGQKGFDLLFINVCEVCFESFPQSILATYSLLIGIVLNTGKGLFGLKAVRIFEASILISWATAARFLATMDEYRLETNSMAEIPLLLKVVRMAFRFSEVSVRVLSIAFFAAIMRPSGLRSHENGQVAVWVLLIVDFFVMFILCRFVAGQQQHNIVYAGICVVCAPLHFIQKLQSIINLYYIVRVLELACMTAIVLATAKVEEIIPILERDDVLWILARVCSASFLVLLLLNFVLAQILPEDRVYGGDSWLIIPRYRDEAPAPSGETAADVSSDFIPANLTEDDWDMSSDGKKGVLEISFAAPGRTASSSKIKKEQGSAAGLKGSKMPLLKGQQEYMPLASEQV